MPAGEAFFHIAARGMRVQLHIRVLELHGVVGVKVGGDSRPTTHLGDRDVNVSLCCWRAARPHPMTWGAGSSIPNPNCFERAGRHLRDPYRGLGFEVGTTEPNNVSLALQTLRRVDLVNEYRWHSSRWCGGRWTCKLRAPIGIKANQGWGWGWSLNTWREINGPFAHQPYSCVFVNNVGSILLAGLREFRIVIITACSPSHPHRSLT